jgi:hypothetical protein
MGRSTYKTTKHTVNTETGEVIQTENWYRKAESSDNFVKFMIDEMYRLFDLSKGEYDVLLGSIPFVDFESTFHADAFFKRTLGNRVNKTPKTISTILSSLVKKGLLYRMSRGRYELNPTVMWKGTDVNRMKRVAYHRDASLREKK